MRAKLLMRSEERTWIKCALSVNRSMLIHMLSRHLEILGKPATKSIVIQFHIHYIMGNLYSTLESLNARSSPIGHIGDETHSLQCAA